MAKLSDREQAAKDKGVAVDYSKPASEQGGSSPSISVGASGGSGGSTAMENLGSLKTALRAALNEAGRKRVADNYSQIAPLAGGVPGSIGSVVKMVKTGIGPAVEGVFSDVVDTFKDSNAAKQKEIDKINELRLEYGSAIPAGVTSLQEAIKYVTPLVDAKKRSELAKAADATATDNDIESWAADVADGTQKITSVPMKIRTAVNVRAGELRKQNEDNAKQQYKDGVALNIEKKVSTYEQERTLALTNGNLSPAEKREAVDYIDSLEQKSKLAKSGGGSSGSGFQTPRDPNASPLTTSPLNKPFGGSDQVSNDITPFRLTR